MRKPIVPHQVVLSVVNKVIVIPRKGEKLATIAAVKTDGDGENKIGS